MRELTPSQRRRLDASAEELDKVCASDARFFERRPERQHRIRRASRAERQHRDIVLGERSPPKGMVLFAVVRNLLPGFRLRLYFFAAADIDTDVSEDEAESIFNAVSPHDPELIRALEGIKK